MNIRKRVGAAKGLMAAFLLGALVSGYVLTTVTAQAAAPPSRYAIAQSALTPILAGGQAGGGAQCPAGFSVTGGGVVRFSGDLRVFDSGPVVNVANVADTWVANMFNVGAEQGSFRIYAICLRVL